MIRVTNGIIRQIEKHKNRICRFFLTASIFLVIAGCATPEYPDSYGDDPVSWGAFKDEGLSVDATYVPFVNTVSKKDEKYAFEIGTDEKVTWYGLFKNNFTLAKLNPELTARWYDPRGDLFLEESFGASPWQQFMIKTSLPLKDLSPERYAGKWQVEIYYEGNLISRKQFHLKGPQAEGGTAPAEVRSDTAAGREVLPETPFFQENYKKAAFYYEEGRLSEAKLALRELLQKEPFRTKAHLLLATIHAKEQNWDESLKELDYALQNPLYRDQALEIRTAVLEMKENKG